MTYAHRRIMKYMARKINPEELKWRSPVCNANWIEWRGTLISRKELALKMGCHNGMLLDFSHPVNEDGTRIQGVLRQIFGINTEGSHESITNGWVRRVEKNKEWKGIVTEINGKCETTLGSKTLCIRFVWDINRLLYKNPSTRRHAEMVFESESNYMGDKRYPYKRKYNETKIQKILYLGEPMCLECETNIAILKCNQPKCDKAVYCSAECGKHHQCK